MFLSSFYASGRGGRCCIRGTANNVGQKLWTKSGQCRTASSNAVKSPRQEIPSRSQPLGTKRKLPFIEQRQLRCVRYASTVSSIRAILNSHSHGYQRRYTTVAATTIPQHLSLKHNRARNETSVVLSMHPSLRYHYSANLPFILPSRQSTFGTIHSHARFSALARPDLSLPMGSSPACPIITRRQFSSKGKGDQNSQKEGSTEPSKDKKNEPGTAAEGEHVESMDPRAFLLGTRESLRKVTSFQAGDMMATYLIVLLLGIILIAPIAGGYMRGSESTYDELDTDDQVEDMARIIRRDFLEKGEDGKGVMDTVLADVLSNKALQEQATKFVVGILESKEVKVAGQRFLKDLWDDLVKDPETTAQVIFLLNVAIQNDDIRLAVKKLVLEIVEDEEVLEELVRLLQKLGQDQEVLDATKTLLSESAHNALNDPEVLDHSMEFATDVVGDDVVQRTAGEALRNTLTYAVKPGMTLLLALSGVGLLFFSVVSLGYATRSSEKEAAVFYDAVSGIVEKIWGTVGLPFQVVGAALNAFFKTVLLPYHFVQRIVARVEYTGSAVNRALHIALSWTAGTTSFILSSASQYGNAVGSFLFRSVASVKTARSSVATWTVGTWSAVVSFFSGMRSSVGVTFQSLSSWFITTSTSLRRQVLSRVWVALGAISNFLMRRKSFVA